MWSTGQDPGEKQQQQQLVELQLQLGEHEQRDQSRTRVWATLLTPGQRACWAVLDKGPAYQYGMLADGEGAADWAGAAPAAPCRLPGVVQCEGSCAMAG